MLNSNVCRFGVPAEGRAGGGAEIRVSQYVLETHPTELSDFMEGVYRLCTVLAGVGKIKINEKILSVKRGDCFLVLPSSLISIVSGDDLQYFYLRFHGQDVAPLLDRLKIRGIPRIYPGMDDLLPLWMAGLRSEQSVIDLYGLGLLYLTLSRVCSDSADSAAPTEPKSLSAESIRDYVDTHFCDETLSLASVGKILGFHPKYVSALFRKSFGRDFTDYLNSIRIRHACSLMDRNFSSIKDISMLCGYRDAAYFSRVFRARMGVSPQEYLKKNP